MCYIYVTHLMCLWLKMVRAYFKQIIFSASCTAFARYTTFSSSRSAGTVLDDRQERQEASQRCLTMNVTFLHISRWLRIMWSLCLLTGTWKQPRMLASTYLGKCTKEIWNLEKWLVVIQKKTKCSTFEFSAHRSPAEHHLLFLFKKHKCNGRNSYSMVPFTLACDHIRHRLYKIHLNILKCLVDSEFVCDLKVQCIYCLMFKYFLLAVSYVE